MNEPNGTLRWRVEQLEKHVEALEAKLDRLILLLILAFASLIGTLLVYEFA